MNKDQLLQYMRNPALLNKADVNELQRVVEEFPSSGILHALYLKALKSQGSYLYPKQLKRTAISVPDRAILHHWVERIVEEKVEEDQRIEFTAAEAITKAKLEAQKQREAEEKKKEAERKAQEKAALEATQAKEQEAPKPSAPKPVAVPVAKTPTKQPDPVKETELDLSNLPASIRETVMRARKIRQQLGEEKAKVSQPEPIVPVAETVAEPTSIPAPQPVEPKPAQAPAEQEPNEVIQPAPQKEELEIPPATPEPILPLVEETTFELSAEEPIKEEPILPNTGQPKYSFIGWLQTGAHPIPAVPAEHYAVPQPPEPEPIEPSFEISANEPIEPTPKAAQATELLESFMEKPRIKFTAPGSDPKIETADLSTNAHSDYITETLAHVYVRQKLYNRAINAYEILRLKYPEKSSFFAAQILEVKNLQKEKE